MKFYGVLNVLNFVWSENISVQKQGTSARGLDCGEDGSERKHLEQKKDLGEKLITETLKQLKADGAFVFPEKRWKTKCPVKVKPKRTFYM